MNDHSEADVLAERLADLAQHGPLAAMVADLDVTPDVAASAALLAAVAVLYRRRDLDAMASAAQAGLSWCQARAAEAEPAAAQTLQARAYAIGFNAAANCWPGWDDPGVVVEARHLSAGASLAAQTLLLADASNLGPPRKAKAYWLVGALALAGGDPDAARAAFGHADVLYAVLGTAAPERLMARGYMALAQMADPSERARAKQALDDTVRRLDASADKEATFFARQLETAERMLLSGG